MGIKIAGINIISGVENNFEDATPEVVKELSKEHNIGFTGYNSELDDSEVPQFIEEVNHALQWLFRKKPTKTVSDSSMSSYTLKHMVEHWSRTTQGKDIYVSTGAMSIAAIMMKYPIKIVSDSPNTIIGISKRTLNPMDGYMNGRTKAI